MSSDFSRQRFQPAKDFSGVLMQQGRVQLDADWNEWHAILDRRWRSETIDVIGRGVVPRETPDGFAIAVAGGGSLTIGRGRIYVHGLQAENHGAGKLEFDPVLAESRGTTPVAYDQQPYFPDPPALPEAGGPHLVYLDVWAREVTAVEDPGLVENAVGVDTTSRVQTAWQVRALPNVGEGVTCATPDEDIPGWLDIIRPSAGRLTTAAVGVATTDDPCLVPPSGGYRGLENRLYRVEIHDGGPVGTATFKCSRDNASVATHVSRIEGGDTLTLDRTAWDAVRRFSPGDWVEVTDDPREFSGAPGEIRRVATVVDATRTLILDAPLTAGLFPVNGQNQTDPGRHTRLKRWDQSGLVRDQDGNTFLDLDAPGSTGLIPVPPAGTSLILEDGVQVTFTTAEPADGNFRSGDYWTFAARTADASVEILDAAPPRGVHHHFCRLALVTFPDVVVDCRTFWPPTFGNEGESCDCTVCVEADAHNQGTFTIQQAVDQIRVTGGTICLGPGIYNLVQTPVRLEGAVGVRIRGQGAATILIQPRADAAFIVRRSRWCTLDYLSIVTVAPTVDAPAVRLVNSVGTTVERLIIRPPAEGDGPLAGVLLEPGFLLLTKVRDNLIRARFGVAFAPVAGETPAEGGGALLLSEFYGGDNAFFCRDAGVWLAGASYYAGDVVLARNAVFTTTTAGIALTGLALTEFGVTDNTIVPAKGDGIVVGCGGARISGNEVVNLAPDNQEGDEGGDQGIRVVPGLLKAALLPVVISENRLRGLRGNGISLETRLASAKVERNVLNALGGHGVVMTEGSTAGSLSVLGNELTGVATANEVQSRGRELAGIHLRNVFEGAVADNVVSGVGAKAALAEVVAGVRVDGSLALRISDNVVTNVAPLTNFAGLGVGVLVLAPLRDLEIADNVVRRQLNTSANNPDDANWQAIRIVGRAGEETAKRRFATFTNLSATERVRALDGFVAITNAAATVAAAAASGLPEEDAGIHGNALHGYGRSPLTEVQVSGTCRFSDNECAVLGQRSDSVVELTASRLIASSNHVGCGPNARSLDLRTLREPILTVLGNITGGPIVVNGGALGAPWQPLNVLAP